MNLPTSAQLLKSQNEKIESERKKNTKTNLFKLSAGVSSTNHALPSDRKGKNLRTQPKIFQNHGKHAFLRPVKK